jgi:hypothetical protein
VVFPELLTMRVLVILHGMSAALALASAIHLWVLLPRRKVYPRGAAWGLLLTLTPLYILGWIAYPAFRTEIRFDLIRELPWMANIFDVKEFLSWGALLAGLAVCIPGLRRRTQIVEHYRGTLRGLISFVIFVLVFNIVIGILLSAHKTL